MTAPDAIVPVPEAIAQRAWECAGDMAREMPGDGPDVRVWAEGYVRRGPERLMWIDCREIFQLHRVIRGARA